MHSASAARLSRDELTTAGRRGSVTVNTTACRADQTENCVSDNFAADENCPVAVSVTAVVSGEAGAAGRSLEADQSLWSLVQQLWFHLMHGN